MNKPESVRVPAVDLKVGDVVLIYGDTTVTVEWIRTDEDSGSTMMAGVTNAGKPHTSHLSQHAKMSLVVR